MFGTRSGYGPNSQLRAYLVGTGDELLVEASPTDTIWGIGLSLTDPRVGDPSEWRGQNLLGFAVIRARAILRGEVRDIALSFSVGRDDW